MADRLHQPALDQRIGHPDHWQQRFGHAAEQLIEPEQRVGFGRARTKAPVQRVAADSMELAEPLEAKPAQHGEHGLVEPERGYRQVGEHILPGTGRGTTRSVVEGIGRQHGTWLRVPSVSPADCHLPVSGRKDRPFRPEMRQRPGRARGRGDRQPRGETAASERRLRIGQHPRLAVEQVRHRADVDQQPVGRVERAPRPPALRPQRQVFEKGAVARRIARGYLQPRTQRARIGQSHSRPRSGSETGVVRCLDSRPMRAFLDENERLGIRALARRASLSQPPAIDRQPCEPDRQYPAWRR